MDQESNTVNTQQSGAGLQKYSYVSLAISVLNHYEQFNLFIYALIKSLITFFKEKKI